MLSRLFSGEVDRAGASARGCGQALRDDGRLLERFRVERRVQQAVQLLGFYLQYGFLFREYAFVHKIHSDLKRGLGCALAVAGLQHVELAFLDGVFHVLHIAVMRFQLVGGIHELLVHFGHLVSQVADGRGGADAGDHVFALRVEKVLAVQLLFAGGGVAGKGHAGAGGLTHVAEHHALDVDGGAPVTGDVVHAAIVDGAGIVPGTEYGLDRFHQLDLGILRKFHAHMFLVDGLEAFYNFLKIFGGQVAVEFHAALFLVLVQNSFELALRDLHNDIGEHRDKAAISVIGKVGIVRLLGEALDGYVSQAQVQDRVHHAGHGSAGAGTDGNQVRIVLAAELLANHFFRLGQGGKNLFLDFRSDLFAVFIILGAGFGRHGESRRNRKTHTTHFGQVGTLAAEQLTHVRVALFKAIHILFCHCLSSLFSWYMNVSMTDTFRQQFIIT